jgi:hypothetical protein
VQVVKKLNLRWIPAALTAGLTIFACAQAHAAPLQFTESVYEALDAIDSQEFEKHKKALEYLLHADEFAYELQARKEIRDASKILMRFSTSGNNEPPTPAELAQLRAVLGTALIANRVTLNSSYLDESLLLENLMKVRFFKENYEQVKVTYENTTRDKAMSLVLAYLVDPRAAKYDPQVAALLTGKNLDGSNSDSKLVFHLPEQVIPTPEGRDSAEVAVELEKDFEAIFAGTPFKPHVRSVSTTCMILSMEVWGMEYAGMVEFWLRNSVAMYHGNRYLSWLSVALEKTSILANSSSAQGTLRTLIESTAAPLAQTSKLIKERLSVLTKGWVDINEEKLIGLEIERFSDRIYRAEHEGQMATLEQKMATAKKYGFNEQKQLRDLVTGEVTVTEKGAWFWDKKDTLAHKQHWYFELTKEASDWVNQHRGKMDELKAVEGDAAVVKWDFLDKMNRTAQELEQVRLGDAWQKETLAKAQDRLELSAAEKIFGQKVITYDRLVYYTTGAIAAYHLFRGAKQLYITQSKDERSLVYEEFVPKLMNDLLYFWPPALELAVSWDVGWSILNTTLLKMLGNFEVGNIESVFRWGYNKAMEAKSLVFHGMSRFEVQRQELETTLAIPQFHQVQGKWTFDALDKLLASKPEQLAANRKQLREEVGQLASKYAALLYILNDRARNRYEKKLGRYEAELNRAYFTDPGSFMNHVKESLAESK